MSTVAPDIAAVAQLRKVRQTRRFENTPVPDDLLQEMLQVARWTGSSTNTQPWQFVVITDSDQLGALSETSAWIDWLADAPMAIAIVLDGKQPSVEYFDEGRVTERILIAAGMLGLGAGTAWLGDEAGQARARSVLGVPEGYILRSAIAIGYPASVNGASGKPLVAGRYPLDQLVSHGTFTNRKPATS
jgi:nitroreductase